MATSVTLTTSDAATTSVTLTANNASTEYHLELGSRGPAGAVGATGPIGPIGPIGIGSPGAPGPPPWVFVGAYDNGADYAIGDAVTYSGGFYYRTGNPNNPGYPPTPGSINASWTPVADKGDPGEGTSLTAGDGIDITDNVISADSSTGGNGAADAGKLVEFNSTGGVAFEAITANSSISTNGATASISTTGVNATIYTNGDNATIYTNGYNATIHTNGQDGHIFTTGTSANIYTAGDGAYIQTSSTFKFFSNPHTTTLSHAPTASRDIAFPNTSGTIALTNPSSGTQTFSGAQSFSSTTRPTSSGTGTPAATSLITRSDLETQLMSDDFVYVFDDFFGGGSVNTGAIAPGPLPWLVTTLIGTSTFRYGANTALNLPCPGGASIQTGTNNRDCGAISFAITYSGGGAIIQNDFNSSTILKWRFYVQSAMGLRIGLGSNPVAPTFQSTRFIGLTGWTPATVWPASTAVSVGNYYRPTTPNGRRYYASVAGTTAGTEPAWPTGAASTVTDGGVTWTEDGRDGETNFQYITRDGTALTGTKTDSGVPYAVGWHTFTLRYLGSNNWGMSVDGASEATLNINVATITILMQAQAYTTGQKHLLFDYFKFFQRVR